VCAVVGFCALSTTASAQREAGPFADLFGGKGTDASQSLSLRWSSYAGHDNVLGEQPLVVTDDPYRIGGDYGGLSAQLGYSRGTGASRFSVFGLAGARAYSAMNDMTKPMLSTGTSFNLPAGKRTSLRGTLFAAYAPYSQLAPFISAGDEMTPFSFGFAVANRTSQAYGADVGISRQLSARANLALEGGWERAQFEQGQATTGTRTARAMLTQNLSKGLAVHGGYGYQDAYFGPAEARELTRVHHIDVGVDFNRALSFSRRTMVSFGTGSSIAQNAAGGAQYFLSGQATLSQGIGRSWTAAAAYNRSSIFAQGFRDLLFLDAVSGSVRGQLATRVQLSSGVSYSFGTVGLGGAAPSIASYTGSSQVQIALTRGVALSASYIYYHYDAPSGATTVPGISQQLGRQALMIGLNGWIPFINERSRRDSR
jgi:hypothetical protein